jgi:hypothetical protein
VNHSTFTVFEGLIVAWPRSHIPPIVKFHI